MERLIAGEAIEKPIHEDVTYADMRTRGDGLWNFLYFTGYLTKAGSAGLRAGDEQAMLSLRIPNAEVKYIYTNIIRQWFDQKWRAKELTPFYNAVREGDAAAVGTMLSDALLETVSFYDYKESYYHGFLAGLLRGIDSHIAKSNRESGLGRSDLVLMPLSIRSAVIIFELKVASDASQLEPLCEDALRQIEERAYDADARAEGYTRFLYYGAAFYKKDVLLRCRKPAENNDGKRG
jgi:hypothetical protein